MFLSTVRHKHPRLEQLLLSLVVLSFLSCGFTLVRFSWAHTFEYWYLPWNLGLAWIPMVFALAFFDKALQRKSWLMIAVLFGAWLLFFPNSFYIITDLMHLRVRDGIPIWFDLMLMFSFIWEGVLLGFISLFLIHEVGKKWFGEQLTWLLVIGLMLLSNFGMYLGRFLRWNSWDIIAQPVGLLRDILALVLHPFAHSETWIYTAFYSIFFLVMYWQMRVVVGEKPEKISRGRR